MKYPYKDGDTAFTHNALEFGYKFKQMEIAALLRYDYNLKFNKDAFELVYNNLNGITPSTVKTYNPQLHASHFSSTGIKLATAHDWSNQLSSKVALSLLNASDLINGDIWGSTTVDNAGSYTGTLYIDYSYDKDKLFKRPDSSAHGIGYALDASMQYTPTDKLHFLLDIRDLLAVIHWNDATYTKAQANTATTTTGADGSLSVKPTLTGVEGVRNVHQRLPARVNFKAVYDLSDGYEAGIAGLYVSNTLLPELLVAKHFNKGQYGLRYDVTSHGLGGYAQVSNFNISLLSDSLNYKEANRLSLTLRYLKSF